jgi:hypothetical protein
MSLLSPQAKQEPATTGKPGWNDQAFGSDVAQKGLLQMIAHKFGQPGAGHAPSDFGTFYSAKKQTGMSDENISQEWLKRQKELQESRIPGMMQGPTPDVNFNRRTGKYAYTDTGKEASPKDIKEKAGNYAWYKTSGAQRLIRRTESIVAPDGAADEAIRFAKLVNNPAGTPINKLTGKAKVAFGQSQRQLLDLVSNVSAEEQQQIFGAAGGGERFLDLAQSLADTNLSVEQYVNAVKEVKYLIYTRQVANVRGTPEEEKWAKMGEKFKADRPFAEPAAGASDMDQFWRK